jgi:hypothetical protein
MELLLVLRPLWRLRIPLAVGVLLAAGALVALGGTRPATSTGAIAWTRLAIDTPRSQLVDTAPDGVSTLTWRAATLMHLLATDESQAEIARRLGVRPDLVAVVDGSFNGPLRATSLAIAATEAGAVIGAPNVVTVYIPDYSMPVISLEAAAADVAGAKRLADVALEVLQSRSSTGGAYRSRIATGGEASEQRQQFNVTAIADVRAEAVTSTLLPMKAIAASMFVLVAWSAGVFFVSFLRHRPHRRLPVPA